jgi:hypothetical protein
MSFVGPSHPSHRLPPLPKSLETINELFGLNLYEKYYITIKRGVPGAPTSFARVKILVSQLNTRGVQDNFNEARIVGRVVATDLTAFPVGIEVVVGAADDGTSTLDTYERSVTEQHFTRLKFKAIKNRNTLPVRAQDIVVVRIGH